MRYESSCRRDQVPAAAEDCRDLAIAVDFWRRMSIIGGYRCLVGVWPKVSGIQCQVLAELSGDSHSLTACVVKAQIVQNPGRSLRVVLPHAFANRLHPSWFEPMLKVLAASRGGKGRGGGTRIFACCTAYFGNEQCGGQIVPKRDALWKTAGTVSRFNFFCCIIRGTWSS